MLDSKTIQKILKNIEKKPGVYQFINEDKQIIYVGKAKNLKSRVSSYFAKSTKHSVKNLVMLKNIQDIKTTVVDTELEAYLLETNLIKELRPKYNILMKDDKNFCYLKITKEPTPKLYKVRKILKDKAIYIGPKTSNLAITQPISILNKVLNLGNCQLHVEILKKNSASKAQLAKSICQIKQLDTSHTPCISDLSVKEQNEIIEFIIDLFKGKYQQIQAHVSMLMQKAAEDKNFESAAKLRDTLFYLQKLSEKQKITSTKLDDNLDVISCVPCGNTVLIHLLKIRAGKLIETSHHIMASKLSQLAEGQILSSFVSQYYSASADFPKEIITDISLDNTKQLKDLLYELSSKNISITNPARGNKLNLLNLSKKNAKLLAESQERKQLQTDPKQAELVLKMLKKDLKLTKLPKRIECYDISHLGGSNTVASMVVFENGQAKKQDYRQFNIKSLVDNKIDDFASINEVLLRRLKYLCKLDSSYRSKYEGESTSIRKDKKQIAELKFEFIKAHQIKIIKIDNPTKKLAVLKQLIYKTIEKHKLKKVYYPAKLTQQLVDLGFKAVKSKHKHALYSYQINKDTSFAKLPDLIVIDGGKGQLSAALKAQKELGTQIEFISIAKRLEEIFKADKTRVLLANSSKSLQLIQRLRNEAHRFAISKNRQKRLKQFQLD